MKKCEDTSDKNSYTCTACLVMALPDDYNHLSGMGFNYKNHARLAKVSNTRRFSFIAWILSII